MKHRKFIWPGLVLAILAASAAWVYATGSGRIDRAGAAPAYLVVDTETKITFTATISDSKSGKYEREKVILVRTDASGEPIDIVGRMLDSGKRGDANRKDSVYSLEAGLNEPVTGPIQFRVAARFKVIGVGPRDNDDDNWDKDLGTLNDPKARGMRQARLAPMIRKLQRYTLSDPIRLTVDPFALPPDPGPAGKQTLEGIDSDHDGIRDDVQRYIGHAHPGSLAARRSLSQYSAAFQALLAQASNEATVRASWPRLFAATTCLTDVFGTNSTRERHRLEAEIMNTRDRSSAYFQASQYPPPPAMNRLVDPSPAPGPCTASGAE